MGLQLSGWGICWNLGRNTPETEAVSNQRQCLVMHRVREWLKSRRRFVDVRNCCIRGVIHCTVIAALSALTKARRSCSVSSGVPLSVGLCIGYIHSWILCGIFADSLAASDASSVQVVMKKVAPAGFMTMCKGLF